MAYYMTEISAENLPQAKTILEELLKLRLITGGQIVNAPARFIWKGELTDMVDYCTIRSFTIDDHASAIIEAVKRLSVEEAPMIAFMTLDDMNVELRNYIDREVGTRSSK